ncbi:hypothetical protein BDB00DRAFT_809421 [Zychaea mexicana]|uniref:uncharacterized protein n=1 Tax=Zychaea mexicana TaxID=64656 RepID=UPI0022FDCA41|nr:uncharacterized protein BDB00DRAFT_809421 [Zychaea mexicana]KAI9496194.1 hypothetical protein BDB00DRAFT_809421 [Zychaea mexicana]
MTVTTYDDLIYQQRPDAVEEDLDDEDLEDSIPQVLKLDLRGSRIDLEREILVSLPESLLIVMFPNGLVLGSGGGGGHGNGGSRTSSDDHDDGHAYDDEDSIEEITQVDFDPAALKHVLECYDRASKMDNSASAVSFHPLLSNKQPIIVLREELEYFCVPCSKNTTATENTTQLKLLCGEHLKQNDKIFIALEKNIARENNVAEQHLIDMLCDAGFDRQDRWSYRALEPLRTCVMSMALVLLDMSGPDNPVATAQKLLLFWRKPARKCWWEGNTVEIQEKSVRLWARRTWTLELSLV